MSDQEQHSGHGHSTFISGILVGILLALLFTTKRGRKLLSIITDEGIGKFNKWEDLLEMLESQIQGEITPDEESVMGEDPSAGSGQVLKEESKHIETSKKLEKKEVLRQAQDEEKFEEKDKEVEKALAEDDSEEVKSEPETIVEKIEEKVKEVEALADELREVKEAIVEKVQESVPEVVKEEETGEDEVKTEEDLPLHKAVEPLEDPSAGSGQDEAPKKKSRRLFKGIRRK